MNTTKKTGFFLLIFMACVQFAAVPMAAETRYKDAASVDHFSSRSRYESQIKSLPPKATAQLSKIIDLLALAGAQTTQWTNGNVWLPFPGQDTDSRGFACTRENVELEDGKICPKVLETHPEWRNEYGLVVGIFKIAPLPSKAVFKAQVGFLKGAVQSDGARFRVYAKKDPSFSATNWCYYDGRLDNIGISLDRYAGQDIELVLEVHVLQTSTQDWAVWVSPRIEWE